MKPLQLIAQNLILGIIFSTICLSCNGKSASQSALNGSILCDTIEENVGSTDTTEAKADSILQNTFYTKADSAKIVQLLTLTPTGTSDVLFYARQFKGIPYVASTLEVKDPEQLIVNVRELDCTTLVETVLALTLTHREGRTSFTDYCRNLMRIRYRHAIMDGYLSRLHYFTWWMHDNLEKEIIEEVHDSLHFTAPIIVNNNYMSLHADKYPLLVKHPEWVDSIRSLERAQNGKDGTFLPESATGLSQQQLSTIHDGDLVAIVTRKAGIDYSHLGFAVWGKDGRLHLLNASSIHHKVVEEPKTLKKYLSEHPSSIGIRLFRLK